MSASRVVSARGMVVPGDGPIAGVSPAAGTAPARHVGPRLEREQLDLFERMVEQGHRPVEHAEPDLVTALTQDDVHEIERRLPPGSTVAGILGHPLEYSPDSAHRRARHHPAPRNGHVDADA
jgi:hypothetical protein